MDITSYSLAAKANKTALAASRHFNQEGTPTDQSSGDTWFIPSTGITYKWMNDGTNDVWLDISTSGTANVASYKIQEETASASQSVFNVDYTIGAVDVYRNGYSLPTSDYTADNGTTITLTTAADLNDIIVFKKYGTFDVANTYTTTDADALLALKEDLSNKGIAGGYAELDGSGFVPASQLPAFVDDVISAADLTAIQAINPLETGKIYIALDTNVTYRWSGTGTTMAEIGSSLALGVTSTTAHRGDHGSAAYNHSLVTTGNPHSVTAAEVGLGNVDNTSDASKPVSTAQQSALDLKADAGSIISAEHFDQESTPTATSAGATWFVPSTGILFKWVNDGVSDIWIDISTAGAGVSQTYVDDQDALKSDIDHTHTGVYEPADATILKDIDIGVNVQAFDANILVDGDIGVSVASQAHDHAGVYEPADTDIVKAPAGVLPVLDGSNLTGVSSGTAFTPTSIVATDGQTVFNATYTVGLEKVFRNGNRLTRTVDYSAINGTSVTLVVAAVLNDEVTIDSYDSFDVANTYTIAQADTTFLTPTGDGSNLTGISSGYTYVSTAVGVTASANEYIIADSSAGVFTITLPASPTLGDLVIVLDNTGSFAINNVTIDRNTNTIMGLAEDMILDLNNVEVQFRYTGTDWRIA